VEAHGFRQTQTAFQSLLLSRGEGSLLRPPLPIFGKPWTTPFEFPLFQWSASWIIRIADVGPDFANRLSSLIWFSLCLIPLWLLARRFLTPISSLIALVFFTYSPFGLQWSRASLIEYCALFFALVFVEATLRVLDSPNALVVIVAAISCSLAGAVKSTTLLSAGVLLFFMWRNKLNFLKSVNKRFRTVFYICVIFAAGLAVTSAWTSHADLIKQQNHFTRFITSNSLKEWNFGTLSQRRIVGNWTTIFDRVDHLMVPKFSFLLMILILVINKRTRSYSFGLACSIFIPVLIFFNLYLVHDYYLIAICAPIALLVGLLSEHLATYFQGQLQSKIAILSVFLGLLLWLNVTASPYVQMSKLDYAAPSFEIAQLTLPNDLIFASHNTWDPSLFYYANRRGLMVDSRAASLSDILKMPDLDEYDFYTGDLNRPDVVQARGWYTPIGKSSFRLGSSQAEFQSNNFEFAFTNIDKDNANERKQSAEISCDSIMEISMSELPTETFITTSSESNNLILVSADLAPVPIGKGLMIFNQQSSNRDSRLRCQGIGKLMLSW
jgi:hypothetical protein